jgi:hypothetical protein
MRKREENTTKKRNKKFVNLGTTPPQLYFHTTETLTLTFEFKI